jgi:hypothetical protein
MSRDPFVRLHRDDQKIESGLAARAHLGIRHGSAGILANANLDGSYAHESSRFSPTGIGFPDERSRNATQI